ncbi:hypothetical protein SORBI_3003G073750 [Sorghum bicolor]|jgi:uncharacterized membrane protein|uniref:Uncharacterized protein n=1 Tax=Sorghum bicolor TaxID=4558 RepID=A0A1B6Q1T8_SORBI|nr:hypothetical protein SORBI_3003G073750 [Sorghum bicolor]
MAPGIGSSTRRDEEDADDHGVAAMPKLHPCGLTGLLAVAFAVVVVVPMAVSDEPPRGIDEKTYFVLALWGVFIAGVAQIFAAVVWLFNNEPRRHRRRAVATTATKLASVATIVVVTAILSIGYLSLPW